MFEVIRDVLLSFLGWVLDRQPAETELPRLLLLLAATAGLSWLIFHWRGIAYRSSAIRRALFPEERYSGRYLQAVLHPKEVRYAIVTIFFNPARKRFEVAGRVYGEDGKPLSAFSSTYVRFPPNKHNNIEFVWQGRRAFSANSVAGYTRMSVDVLDGNYVEGTGLVMNFEGVPKIHPILFKRLHDRLVVEALGRRPPKYAAEEPEFIKKFHSQYGDAVKEGLLSQNGAEEQEHALVS